MSAQESQITGVQTDSCCLYIKLMRATHETVMCLHDFPCGTRRETIEAEGGYHLQARIARMARHRDLAGECDWIAVDCDKKGAPMPIFCETRVANRT